jgi:uncharacterized metal-binding protein YceD (DUF177 family)
MNTGPEDQLAYRDLARRRARVVRTLNARELTRVWPLVTSEGSDAVPVEVDLRLRLDPEGVAWVDGTVVANLNLFCTRCAESVGSRVVAEVSVCVAEESRASELAESRDVHAVDGPMLSLMELVEDALLLELPERLCVEDPCPRLPSLAYPAAGSAEAGAEDDDGSKDDARSPFAALAALKESRESGDFP